MKSIFFPVGREHGLFWKLGVTHWQRAAATIHLNGCWEPRNGGSAFFYPRDSVDGFIPIGWTLSLFSKVSNISGQRGAFLRSYFVKKKCKMACCLEMSLTSNFTKMISRERMIWQRTEEEGAGEISDCSLG